MKTTRRSFWKGEPEHVREMFVLQKPQQAPIRCSLWTHPHGYELRLFVGGSLLQTREEQFSETIDDIVTGWRSGLQTRGWVESKSKRALQPAKWVHTEDGQVCGYLDGDGESLFTSSGEMMARLEGTLVYTAKVSFWGTSMTRGSGSMTKRAVGSGTWHESSRRGQRHAENWVL